PGAAQLDGTVSQSTRRLISNGHVVVLVADIRNYTSMSETLPTRELSQLLAEWFARASAIVERHTGIIDKFIGDAIIQCCVVASKSVAANQVNQALAASRDLLACAGAFSHRFNVQFPEYTFRIGVALNIGEAMFGNVGTGTNQSFTVVGDCVNV